MLGSLSPVHNRNVLGAGLRREFPGAFEWADGMRRRVPSPTVSRSGVVWAVLAGLGAKALAGAAIALLVSTVLLMIDTRDWRGLSPLELREGLARFVSGAVGLAVALRAGGWRAVIALIAALTAADLAHAALAAPGRALFCERAGGSGQPEVCASRSILEELLARWPLIAGLAGGWLLSKLLRVVRPGSNAAPEAIGAVVAGQGIALAISVPFTPGPETADTMLVWIRLWTVMSLINLIVSLVGGHVLARRGARPWPGALIVAPVFFIAPWLPTLVYAAGKPAPDVPGVYAWIAIAPLAHALAFILASVVTAAFAPPRPPDADAARRAAR